MFYIFIYSVVKSCYVVIYNVVQVYRYMVMRYLLHGCVWISMDVVGRVWMSMDEYWVRMSPMDEYGWVLMSKNEPHGWVWMRG